jgi:hypothetical protein
MISAGIKSNLGEDNFNVVSDIRRILKNIIFINNIFNK